MRYLGIDYGSKRVGLALSDEAGDFSYPYQVIQNTIDLAEKILNICQAEGVGAIVIGESKNFNNEPNPIMKEIGGLEVQLREKGLVVHLEPEYLTSAEAERGAGKDKELDARAASIILRSFLDRRRHAES